MRLAPSSIRFTQDSVSCRFGDGSDLSDTFKDLLYGTKTSDDIQDMEVVELGGIWWALTGNRRLYIYRKLEKLGRISEVSVRVRDLCEPRVIKPLLRRMTTKTKGLEAVCRQPEADTIMELIAREWKEELMRQQQQRLQQQLRLQQQQQQRQQKERQRMLEEENRRKKAAEEQRELMEQEKRKRILEEQRRMRRNEEHRRQVQKENIRREEEMQCVARLQEERRRQGREREQQLQEKKQLKYATIGVALALLAGASLKIIGGLK